MATPKTYIYDNVIATYGDDFIKNFPAIVRCVNKYINSRADVLQTKYMSNKLIFTAVDENAFMDAAGVDKSILIKLISESDTIKPNAKGTTPLYQLLYILSKYYTVKHNELVKLYKLDPDINSDKSPKHIIQLYFGMRLYSWSQKYIFAHPFPEQDAEYAIAHLSNKSDIIKFKNIYEIIKNKAFTIEEAPRFIQMAKRERAEDNDTYEWVNDIFNKFKSQMKNFFVLCLYSHDHKLGIKTENLTAHNEEGDEFYVISDSVSNAVDITSKKLMNTFVQDTVIREQLIQSACKHSNKVSCTKTKIVLKNIRESGDSEMLLRIMTDIVSYWLISMKKSVDSIHSKEFAAKCSKAYSVSNTYDIFIIDLKKTLGELIIKYNPEYTMAANRGTIGSFKQAIYLYLIMYIMTLK